MGKTQADSVNADSLKLEIERIEIEYNEKLNQHQTRYNTELTAMRDQLNEADTHKNILKQEVQQLKEKLEISRVETMNETEERISEFSKRHEREKKILVDDNRKLISELEIVNESVCRLQNERLQMDNDYEELRNKRQAIAQWENQISEIIQVSEFLRFILANIKYLLIF